ncbi:uncharacterized protein [Gossypium hirsutum]|uniref:Retrotransposon gag domain-containing protein n=1 Tax=Gossypium hirsutum TaxID=3635 RepID=A0A1U8N4J5_GOSHI|nr:uncharacterized protein LOC107944592 [Gossypium hirsutum]
MSTRGTRGSGSHDRAIGDDALSQAMLQVLERVARAKYWLEATEWIMDDLDCTVEQKLKGAVSLLRDEAYQWWLTVGEGTQADRLTWDFFKASFQGKYVGTSYVDAQRKEFLNLTQGNKTMAAYEAEFLRLSHYARGIVVTEYECCMCFKDGLRDELRNRDKDRGRGKRDFGSSISASRPVKRAKFDGWFELEILLLLQDRSPVLNVEDLIWARGGNGFIRGRGAPGRGTGNTEARQPALVYATHRREDGDAPDVITGTFLMYNFPYVALIDIGSMHSYVVCTVSGMLGIQSENTDSKMTMLSPLDQSVRVDKLFRDVPLEVQGVVFLANLMELPFGEFDIALGMDWLTVKDEEVTVIGERRDFLSNVILALRAEKLVRKGCKAFLAYVSNFETKSLAIEDVRTVKEFSDVFLEELPGLPLDREVEFRIELLPGVAPVSAPDRMAPKELMELNAQIEELLD